jgi:uncharacterized protein YajQ (UPF0234 family)
MTHSFDIVSEIDLQEVDNAVNQTIKEVNQRYDLKDSKCEIDYNKKDKKITLSAKDDFKVKSVNDVLQAKMVKRGISLKALKYGDMEQSSSGHSRQTIELRQGIDKDTARLIVKMIKDTKLKVQASIMDVIVRVTGKDKDVLQSVMKMLREADLDVALQFTNYRENR